MPLAIYEVDLTKHCDFLAFRNDSEVYYCRFIKGKLNQEYSLIFKIGKQDDVSKCEFAFPTLGGTRKIDFKNWIMVNKSKHVVIFE